MKDELGVTNKHDDQFESIWNEHAYDLCLDRHVNTLLPILTQELRLSIDPEYDLLTDGFLSRFEPNESIWPIIEALNNKVKIGLITDMYPGMLDAIQEIGILPTARWDRILDSSVVKYRKPNEKIFELAQNQTSAKPDEILFVDNKHKNLVAPQNLGWHTHHYDSADYLNASKALEDYLATKGVL